MDTQWRGAMIGSKGISVISATVLAITLGACGNASAEQDQATEGDTASDYDWQEGAGDEWEEILSAAQEEGSVVLDSSPELTQSSFTSDFERDTGLEIVAASGESSARYTAMEQEARANRLSIDVALGGGDELPMREDGLLNEIEPQLILPGVTDPDVWIDGGPKWMDNENTYMFQGSNYVYGWIVVNEDTFDMESFESWDDLLDPKYAGKIVSYEPVSGPGLAQSAFLYDALGEEYVDDLYLGQEVVNTTDRRQLVEWVARGTYDIALGATQAEVERYAEEGINVTGLMPAEGIGQLSGGSSVLKQPMNSDGTTGPNPNAATVFINWYASKAGQESYSAAMNEISTRNDVDAPTVPDYVRPEPDREYTDTYEEEWYAEVRPAVAEEIRGFLD